MTDLPLKYDVFGVGISGCGFDACLSFVMQNAIRHESVCIDHMPVHGLMTAVADSAFNQCISSFDVVAADGQPVRYALNRFHGIKLTNRVYGPDFMLAACSAAAAQNVSVFLCGSTERTIDLLIRNLTVRVPGLTIAGAISPPFREMSPEEETDLIDTINRSGAGIVFIGMGCPTQELLAARLKGRVNAVMDCVGAAFDFHAGTKSQAPKWMQAYSLEWLFRMVSEPRRLGQRYLKTNTAFLFYFLKKIIFK